MTFFVSYLYDFLVTIDLLQPSKASPYVTSSISVSPLSLPFCQFVYVKFVSVCHLSCCLCIIYVAIWE